MSARPFRLWPWVLIPVVAVTAFVTFAIVGALTVGAAGPYPWPWWGFFPWFPFVGIWIFFGFLFLFGVFRWGGGPWSWGYEGPRDESRTILRERYARGEITRDRFDEMRRDLDEHEMGNPYEGDGARRAGP